MNTLLLAQAHTNPQYVNRLYITLAGSFTGGILLEYLIKQVNIHNSTIYISDSQLCKQTELFSDELSQAKAKLKRLSFLNIVSNKDKSLYKFDLFLFHIAIEEVRV